MEKEVLEFRVEFPKSAERELKESFAELLKNFELGLRFSVAQKLVERKGLEKEIGEKLAKEVKTRATRRLRL